MRRISLFLTITLILLLSLTVGVNAKTITVSNGISLTDTPQNFTPEAKQVIYDMSTAPETLEIQGESMEGEILLEDAVYSTSPITDAILTIDNPASRAEYKAQYLANYLDIVGENTVYLDNDTINITVYDVAYLPSKGLLQFNISATVNGVEKRIRNPYKIYNPPAMVQVGANTEDGLGNKTRGPLTESINSATLTSMAYTVKTIENGEATFGDGDPTLTVYPAVSINTDCISGDSTANTFLQLIVNPSPSYSILTGTYCSIYTYSSFTSGDLNVYRHLMSYNTSSISTSTVVSSSLNVYKKGLDRYNYTFTPSLTFTKFNPANPTSYTTATWKTNLTESTVFTDNMSNTVMPDGIYNSINLTTNGISQINKTGYTNIMGRILNDTYSIDIPEKTGGYGYVGIDYYTANYTGTDRDPYLLIVYAIDPPNSTFTSNVTSGFSPLPVQFNDTSTNEPTSWTWNATNVTGNNTPFTFSTIQNATYTFGIGNFSIKLNSSNVIGSNVSTQVTFINVSQIPPVASFTSNVTSGTTPLSVQFNDTSTNEPTSWTWNATNVTGNNTPFTFSTIQNATYTFGVGNFSIKLNSSNVIGSNVSTQVTFINVTKTPEPCSGGAYGAWEAYGDGWRSQNDVCTVIKWNTSGNKANWVPSGNVTAASLVEYVVVGGGGGGGRYYGSGGGGAGAFWSGSATGFTSATTVTVGGGGAVAAANSSGTSGGNSAFDTIIAVGGSGGSSRTTTATSLVLKGGSAGGGASPPSAGSGASNDTNQSGHGKGGGTGLYSTTTNYQGGGGGGVISNGSDAASAKGGNGGNGTYTNITGTILPLAGGGGGGCYQNSASARGSGGSNQSVILGGSGSYRTQAATTPVASTGSGGGGGGSTTGGSAGASGIILIKFTTLPSPPVTSFTSNVTSGSVSVAVQFNDTTTNNPTAWIWNATNVTGNNTPFTFATIKNATYTFGIGNFSISLNASNEIGSDVSDQVTFINVSMEIPQTRTGFTVDTGETDPLKGYTGFEVVYNVTLPNDNATVWNWSFGDGNWQNGTSQNATHIYGTGGLYTIKEIASNSYTTNTTTLTNYLTIFNETFANFTFNYTSTINYGNITVPPTKTVWFNDTSLNATMWNWTWTPAYSPSLLSWYNTSISSQRNISLNFSNGGIYAVGLLASDRDPNYMSVFYEDGIVVFNQTVSGFTANVTSGPYPLNVGFNVTNPNDNATTWNWSFGDGNWQNGTEQNATHVYTSSGSFTVTEISSNMDIYLETFSFPGGSTNTTTRINYITTGALPIPNFTANATSVYESYPLQFTSDSTFNILTYNWSFGNVTANPTDYSFNESQNPVWYCPESGKYSVSLNITNASGSNSTTKYDYIDCLQLVDTNFELSFTPSSQTIQNGSTYLLTSNIAKLSPLQASIIEVRIEWDEKILNISNIRGNSSYFSGTNISFTPHGDEDFKYDPTNGTAYFGVNRTLFGNFSAVGATERPIVDYDVKYMNYTSQPSTIVNHTYGEYYDANNPLHTPWYVDIYKNATYTLTTWTIGANFTSNTTSGFNPLLVQFNDTSSGYPNRWNWSWGDNTYTNQTTQNASHTYSAVGTYTVTLRSYLSLNNSVSNTSTKTNYITVVEGAPVSSFTSNVTFGVAPLSVGFNDTSSNTPTAWNWSFGDGTYNNSRNSSKVYGTGGNYTVILNATNTNTTAFFPATKYITVFNQTRSGFTANTTSGLAPLAVGFNVSLVNDNATQWNWSFGDGTWTNGTTQNVTHLYTTGGNFTIIEIASNSAATNTTTRTQYVNVTLWNQTRSGFTANATTGVAPKTIGFNVTLVNDNATQWNWSFGDGTWTNGTTQNVSHAYNNGGIFTIIQIASNPTYTNTTTRTNYLTLYNQTRSGFTANVTSGVLPLNVGFNVSLVNDNATQWNWSFGDGAWTNGTTQNVTHVYSSGGTFTVIEIASNAGATNTTTRSNYITIGNQTRTGFTANATTGVAPRAIGFNVSLVNDNATIWNWSFGDGTWQNGTTQNATHLYSSGGIFSVTEIASNAFTSNSTTITNYITIGNQTRSGFTANVTSGVAPRAIGFNVTLVNDNATMWNWSFGDGTWDNDTTQNVSHYYSNGGIFTVIEVTSNSASSNTTIRSNYITLYNQTVTGFTANVTSGLFPLNVGFNVTTVNDNATVWNWSFGDGTWQNGTTQNATHVYGSGGSYTITQIASNTGATNTTTITDYITVFNQTHTDFSANQTVEYVPMAVQFTDSSSNATSWFWIFGDGNTSVLQNPVFTYNIPGNYSVNHSSSNAYHTSWENKSGYINASLLVIIVDFTGTPTTGAIPLSVQFNDTTFGGTGWNWSFGDGSYSTLQNPVHNYTTASTFNVMLLVANGTHYNYTTKTGYITTIMSNYVEANFVANITSGNYPLAVQFNDTSVCDPNCTSWNWDFNGDGSIDSIGHNPIYTYTAPMTYSPKLIASNGYNSGTKIRLKYITVGPEVLPTPIPQPTATAPIGYVDPNTGMVVSFQGDASMDVKNSTYLKGWLQNFSATGEFNVVSFATSLMAPLLKVFGFWIFLIIWGLYLFAVWIRSQDVTLPLVIGVLSIGIFGLLFPKESMPVIIIMLVICGAIIITKLLKDSI